MKKLFFTFVIGCFSMSSFAQTSAGNMMVGGAFSVRSNTSQSNDDYKNSEFAFAPSFGYFVSDRFAVGLNLGLSTSTSDDGSNLVKNNRFSFGPFARYYKYTSNDQFAFFAQTSLSFVSGKYETTPGGETKSSSMYFNLAPGFAYFFNNHWAAELSFQGLGIYTNDPNKDGDDDKSTTVSFDLQSLSPSIGVRYHFGGN